MPPWLIVAVVAAGPVTFVDRTAELGLPGGDAACWVDLDQDGWPDIVTGGAAWRNVDGQRFEKLADVGSSVAADYDNDGYPDLFCWANLTLWHNDAGRGLSPVPLPALPPCVSRGACWGDFNGDGFVDLYIGGYESWEPPITYPDLILTNRGGTGFALTWSEERYRARGVTAADFDEDGDLDVYVSNYRLQPNVLWRNDGFGAFSDVAAEFGALATSPGFNGGHGIGACWGDFDADGRLDLFAGNFAHVDQRGDQPKSRFLRNLGPAGDWRFEDLGERGIPYQESYASPAAGDFDNDGDLDLIFTTVYETASFGRPNHAILFANDGAINLTDANAATNLPNLPPTYQAAWADFDRDGDLDLSCGGRLFVNSGGGGHWLELTLVGDGRHINRSAIGAQVRIALGDRTLTRQVEAGTGEGNQNDLTVHVGLGGWDRPVRLELRFPGAEPSTYGPCAVDSRITIRLGE